MNHFLQLRPFRLWDLEFGLSPVNLTNMHQTVHFASTLVITNKRIGPPGYARMTIGLTFDESIMISDDVIRVKVPKNGISCWSCPIHDPSTLV